MQRLKIAPEDRRPFAIMARDLLPALPREIRGWRPSLEMSGSIIWTRATDRMCFFATPWWDDAERTCDTAWCDDDGETHLIATYHFPASDAPLAEIKRAYLTIVHAMIAQRAVFDD